MTKKPLSVRTNFDIETLFEAADGSVPRSKIRAWLSDHKNRDAMTEAMNIAALGFFFDDFSGTRRSFFYLEDRVNPGSDWEA
jgi:hypothetical protein